MRIKVASHQNKKGFAMRFNSSNSIVSLFSINSCVGYSTKLNKCHRIETGLRRRLGQVRCRKAS